MLKLSAKTLSLTAALALSAAGAWAQTSSTPTTVGATQQEAQQATQNAVPRADTATLVRTGPSATDRANDTMRTAQVTPSPSGNSPAPQVSNSQNAMGTSAGSSGTANTNNTGASNMGTTSSSDTGMTNMNDSQGTGMRGNRMRNNRAARADRN